MERIDLANPPPRVVVRHSIDFLLRAVRSVSRNFQGDLLGGLVVLALLQREFSQASPVALDSPERDGARPISVKSLARSLKTPPETMRRCVARLIERDWCVRIAREGIAISNSRSSRARVAALMTDIRLDFLLMVADFKAIGFDFGTMGRSSIAGDPSQQDEAAQNARGTIVQQSVAIDRAILNFGLRIVDSGTTPFGNDYVMACVFSAIMSANASPIAYDPEEAWRYSTPSTPPPDALRRPVNLTEVSQILGIPYETARRYVNTLIARGRCARDERKGLLIPMELLQRPEAILVGMEVVGRFVQLVGDLKHLGFDFRAVAPMNLAALQAERRVQARRQSS